MVRPLIAHVVGARPNYMKVAPVYSALATAGAVEQRLVHTGQHYDAALKDVFFRELPLPQPHVELAIGSGTHGEQTAAALVGLEATFVDMRPDLVVAAGDVNSTLAAALAAVKLGIPVCHLEAGLRSFDWSMPEEHNRRLTDHLSDLLLTHSSSANDNLEAEGIPGDRVALVGNTMIDSLFACVDEARELAAWNSLGVEHGGYVLVTLHRPSLVDSPALLATTMAALGDLSRRLPVVFPVHPRTRTRLTVAGAANRVGLHLIDPLPYRTFVSLEIGAAAVVTDSGGVQEETTALGVPCFTLRDNTERPVTITDGTNVLLGLDPGRLRTVVDSLGAQPEEPKRPQLWDGRAGIRAAAEIERLLLGSAATRLSA